VLASHYAEAVERTLLRGAPLLDGPDDVRPVLADLPAGTAFAVVEDSVGWAWGYAGHDRRVGYVRSEALGPKARS
jgi:hypothetical protein